VSIKWLIEKKNSSIVKLILTVDDFHSKSYLSLFQNLTFYVKLLIIINEKKKNITTLSLSFVHVSFYVSVESLLSII